MYKGSDTHKDDFNKRRLISHVGIRQGFAEPWQFRVLIDAMPQNLSGIKGGSAHSLFDFLVKDVSFGPTELAGEPVEVGGTVFTFPKSSQPTTITMTVKDSDDWQLYTWFNEWASKVVNADGSFNTPSTFIKKLIIRTYKDDQAASEAELWSGMVYPQKMGDIQMSVDGEKFVEFPIVFQQFRSLN